MKRFIDEDIVELNNALANFIIKKNLLRDFAKQHPEFYECNKKAPEIKFRKKSDFKKARLDRGIVPVITLLNNNGLKTRFCCSGHPKQARISLSTGNGYIYFKKVKDARKFVKEVRSIKKARFAVSSNSWSKKVVYILFPRKGTQKDINHYWKIIYNKIAESFNKK